MLTYEQLIAECEMHGFKLVPKTEQKVEPKVHHTFTAIARFERGLGAEYVSLKPIVACTIGEAQNQANELAATYFKTTEGFEKAVIIEVRVRPHDK